MCYYNFLLKGLPCNKRKYFSKLQTESCRQSPVKSCTMLFSLFFNNILSFWTTLVVSLHSLSYCWSWTSMKWERQVPLPIASLPLPARLPLKIWGGVEVHNKWNHLPSPANKPVAHCSAQWGCQKSQPLDKVPAGFLLSRLSWTWVPSTNPVTYIFVSLKPTIERSKKLLVCI